MTAGDVADLLVFLRRVVPRGPIEAARLDELVKILQKQVDRRR